MSITTVLSEALQLAPSERADVARRLIASLDEAGDVDADEDVEASWLAEAERRLHEVDSGKAPGESWSTVRERIALGLRAIRP